MKNLQNHIIKEHQLVIEALKKINQLPKTLTLFVVNHKNQLIGTITDGDIRRGLINGKTLENRIGDFVSENFYSIENGHIDVNEIKRLKEERIRLLPVINNKKEIEKVYDLQKLRSVLPLDAVIMAGGRGERLRPLTDKTPKPMLKIGGKPIIEYNIDRLISYGIENIYISVNYLKEQIMDYFGDGSDKGINIHYVHEDKPLGTAGSIRLIDSFKNNNILLMNSDLFTNVDFEDLYLKFTNKNAAMGIASTSYIVNIPYAIFDIENDSILSFKEKPSNTHYANAGIYIFNKDHINKIPINEFYNITNLIEELIRTNQKVIHNPIIGYWIDIGKTEDFKNANEIAKHLNNE